MKITAYLADAATPDPSGKVNALGLGWSETVTPLQTHAVVVILEAELAETGKTHHFTLDLVNEDGQIAAINRQRAIEANGEVSWGVPVTPVAGATYTQTLALPIPPGIALPHGKRWEYRVTVGLDVGSVSFTTRQ